MEDIKLVHLKTALETHTRERLVDIWITTVATKSASSTLNSIRRILPEDGGLNLQHLRRFVKYDNLPQSLRNLEFRLPCQAKATSDNGSIADLYLIVGSTNEVPKQTLLETLSSALDHVSVCMITVPLLAPTSQEQANLWSSKYWPTVYKKSNPFGPHPSLVSWAEVEIREDAEQWMNLAMEAACEASTTGIGERIGVAIVERQDGVPHLLAVAGDARWLDWPRSSSGNATGHAMLRGIAMIADGLRSDAEMGTEIANASVTEATPLFTDSPLGRVERENRYPSVNGNGYLCHELEIYCTHEPCVMCSMAIVHSRFSRVIFGQRMPQTGGLCADGELGHGLFWRKELNWTLLAWNYPLDKADDKLMEIHA